MLWLTDNMADDGSWSSPNDSDPYYPVANLQDYQVGRVWKSLGASANERLDLDLGTGYSALTGQDAHIIIHGHNLDGADSVLIQATNDNTWASYHSMTAIDPSDHPDGTIHVILDKDELGFPFRYWRFSITKASAGKIAQVGRIYVGPVYDSTALGDPDHDGLSRETVDPSIVAKSPGNQRFVERKSQYAVLKLDFSYLSETVIAVLRATYQDLGRYKPFFLQVSTEDGADAFYYVAFASNFPEKVTAFGGEFYWNSSLTLEQQL